MVNGTYGVHRNLADPTRVDGLLRGLVVREEKALSAEEEPIYLAAINRISQVPLAAEEIYIRSMYLTSTQYVESDASRFTKEALEQIAELVIGRSVMVGHAREQLPLARFFRAQVVQREGIEKDPATGLEVWWVRAWFYWLRATSGARDLLLNIDGGIYRDVSISWRVAKQSCSICGQAAAWVDWDTLACGHHPGKHYEGQLCHIMMEEVSDVLEGSIVFAGADAGAVLAARKAIRQGQSGKGTKGQSERQEELFPNLAVVELEVQLGKMKRVDSG